MQYIDALDIRINQEATGNNIKKLIEENGCSITELQNMLHLGSVQAIYRWLKGGIPSIDNLVCLSEIFELPIDQIIVVEKGGCNYEK